MNLAENLKEVLINDFRGKPVSGGKDIVIKCKYCNDKRGKRYHFPLKCNFYVIRISCDPLVVPI